MKILLLIILAINSMAIQFKMYDIERRNAKFILSKTPNKEYARFLIALSWKESRLDQNRINECDVRRGGRCYDSIGFMQVNLHTAKLLYPKVSLRILERKLKNSRAFNLSTAKLLLKENLKIVSPTYQDKRVTKAYIIRALQIYNGGVKNIGLDYANHVYRKYKELEGIKID